MKSGSCFRPVPKGVKRLKTQADEGLTTADEAGYVVLSQPLASKLANLFRIDVRDHALGLVTQQLGGCELAYGDSSQRRRRPSKPWKNRDSSLITT